MTISSRPCGADQAARERAARRSAGGPARSGRSRCRSPRSISKPALSTIRSSAGAVGLPPPRAVASPRAARPACAASSERRDQLDRVGDDDARRGRPSAGARARRPGRAGAAAASRGRRRRSADGRAGRGRRPSGRAARRASPSASRASAKPCVRALDARAAPRRRRSPRRRSRGGQSQRSGSSMSIATTSAAPRRSISNAQKPSHVPTSRQRRPSRRAGSGTLRGGRGACRTSPASPRRPASSIEWYHSTRRPLGSVTRSRRGARCSRGRRRRPTGAAANHASRISSSSACDVVRRLSASTFASFHLRAPSAVCASAHSAARMPGTLFAAIDAPVPVQQQTTRLVGAALGDVARRGLARPRPVGALAVGQRAVGQRLVAARAQRLDDRVGDAGPLVARHRDPHRAPSYGPCMRRLAARGVLVNGAFDVGADVARPAQGVRRRGVPDPRRSTASSALLAAALGHAAVAQAGRRSATSTSSSATTTRSARSRSRSRSSWLLSGVVLRARARGRAAHGARLRRAASCSRPGSSCSLAILGVALQTPIWPYYRSMDFVRQRTLQAVDPIVAFVVTVALAAAGAGYWALVIGLVAGSFAGAAVAIAASPYPLRLRWDRGDAARVRRRSRGRCSSPSCAGIVVAQSATLVARVLARARRASARSRWRRRSSPTPAASTRSSRTRCTRRSAACATAREALARGVREVQPAGAELRAAVRRRAGAVRRAAHRRRARRAVAAGGRAHPGVRARRRRRPDRASTGPRSTARSGARGRSRSRNVAMAVVFVARRDPAAARRGARRAGDRHGDRRPASGSCCGAFYVRRLFAAARRSCARRCAPRVPAALGAAARARVDAPASTSSCSTSRSSPSATWLLQGALLREALGYLARRSSAQSEPATRPA